MTFNYPPFLLFIGQRLKLWQKPELDSGENIQVIRLKLKVKTLKIKALFSCYMN